MIAIKYEAQIKLPIPIVSNAVNAYITVPFDPTAYKLNRLANNV